MCVWDNALRRARNVVSLAEIFSEVGTQYVDHCTIAFVLLRLWCKNTLNVKIEPINHSVTEGSRTIISTIFGAESVPKKISELHSAVVVLDVLIIRIGTTKRQQHGLALFLAVADIRTNVRAKAQEGAFRAIFVYECWGTALISEVCARISATLIGENVQKGEIDDVDAVIVTIVPETLLICSLTLSKYSQQPIQLLLSIHFTQ